MPGERLSMRQIREVLRLRFAQRLSQRAVGRSLGLSTGAVNGYLSRARRAGLSWPLPETLDEAGLEALLYPQPPDVAADRRPVPDWAVVHLEMRRPNVTLSLLWEEYRGGPGAQDGFGYWYFCERYSEWVGRLSPTMRQVHPASERAFVDFAGHTLEVIDATTGEVHRAEVFVGVLGASSYVFAQATWTHPWRIGLPRTWTWCRSSEACQDRSSATICAPGSRGGHPDYRRAFAIRYLAPHVRRNITTTDGVTLARGQDRLGHFEHEPAPA
jgi:hypothetical protein